MAKNNPKISIVIPVYNGSNYLADAVDSALAQTYDNYEVIVVNDGSTDDGATEAIAKSYGDKIRYFSKKNGGVATALNLGIEKMTGDYFSWLSHDDRYKPNKLESQVKFLSGIKPNKNVVIYADYELIDEQGKRIGNHRIDHELVARTPIYALLRGNVNGITMLIPKLALETCGTFDASLRCTQDYDMWFRMFKDFTFVHQQEILTQTRIHALQDTTSNPVTITEANALWVRMVHDTKDEVKIAAEGSLLNFYYEMVKFLSHHTPYEGAKEYCENELKRVISDGAVEFKDYATTDEIQLISRKLKSERQNVAAAQFIAAAVRHFMAVGNDEDAATLISRELIGEMPGASNDYIAEHYLPNIGGNSRKKRLMFCSGHWLTGGMERVLSILFRQLKDDYELFLITPYDGQDGLIELPAYVTHIKMSDDQFYNSFDTVSLTYALLLGIDVVIGFMNLFTKQLDLYNLCNEANIKTIASNHEIYFYPYTSSSHYELVQKRINTFRDVDAVLWLTNFSATAYGLINANSYLMPNPNTYKVQDNSLDRDEKIILCVGRFNDYIKRVDRMLACFSIVSRKIPDAKLVLVGKYDMDSPVKPGDRETIRDLMAHHGLDERRVVFTGETKHVDEYYGKASALLLTSNNEGFGMVINEAACFGVPSVCNRIPGLEDLVVDGVNGYLVKQDDMQGLADALVGLLSDESLRKKMGNNAKRLVHQFDEDKIGDKWKYLIDTICTSQPKSALEKNLRTELGYKTDDYAEYGKLLLDEMGKMVAASLGSVKAHEANFINSRPAILRYALKIHRAIRLIGWKQSVHIVLKNISRRLMR